MTKRKSLVSKAKNIENKRKLRYGWEEKLEAVDPNLKKELDDLVKSYVTDPEVATKFVSMKHLYDWILFQTGRVQTPFCSYGTFREYAGRIRKDLSDG
jgi:hypothetical protein